MQPFYHWPLKNGNTLLKICLYFTVFYKKSYRKETMPQNKNLTHIHSSGGGTGGHDGVYDERKTDFDQGVRSPVSTGGPENEKRYPG
jgi:hypothetical protein